MASIEPPMASGLVRSTREAALEELTAPEAPTLSPEKIAVLRELAQGNSVTAAAAAGGVNRRTVSNWMRGDADFVAALNAWRNQSVQWAKDQLVATLCDAAVTVREAVRNGDAKLAMQLLQLQSVAGPVEQGLEAPEEVRMQHAIQRRRQKLALQRRESSTSSDEYVRHPLYKEFRKRRARGTETRSWFECVADFNRQMKLARQGVEDTRGQLAYALAAAARRSPPAGRAEAPAPATPVDPTQAPPGT
ncbi:MAG TPA: helix-turn-helix domain-containing protein [Tepidisphaeraceae bacterium]|nr:helix-turn-helix domain-containing protein [Tepidisphaeraceae bacterium]